MKKKNDTDETEAVGKSWSICIQTNKRARNKDILHIIRATRYRNISIIINIWTNNYSLNNISY